MVEYEFATESGQVVTIMYPMGQAPSIGETTMHEGETVTRIASGSCKIQDKFVVPFASQSQCRNHKDWHKFDKEGRPLFESRSEVREFCARTGTIWDR